MQLQENDRSNNHFWGSHIYSHTRFHAKYVTYHTCETIYRYLIDTTRLHLCMDKYLISIARGCGDQGGLSTNISVDFADKAKRQLITLVQRILVPRC